MKKRKTTVEPEEPPRRLATMTTPRRARAATVEDVEDESDVSTDDSSADSADLPDEEEWDPNGPGRRTSWFDYSVFVELIPCLQAPPKGFLRQAWLCSSMLKQFVSVSLRDWIISLRTGSNQGVNSAPSL